MQFLINEIVELDRISSLPVFEDATDDLVAAVLEQKPRLFWLSVSHLEEEDRFVEQFTHAYESFESRVAVAVGGRALSESVRQRLKYTVYCDTMQHLESFARTMFAVSRDGQPSDATS